MKKLIAWAKGLWLCHIRGLHSPVILPHSATDERKRIICARCGRRLQ